MSGFYGIPNLASVTAIGAQTSTSLILDGGLSINGFMSVNDFFEVNGTGTWNFDQNVATSVFYNFGSSSEARIGYDGSQFVIDTVTGGSGAKVYIGDGTTGSKVICGELTADGVAASVGSFGSGSCIQPVVGATVFQIATTTINDDPTVRWQQGRVATTDATPTTIQTISTTANTCIMVDVSVVARRTGGTGGTAGDVAAYQRRAAYKNIAGVVTQIGVTTDDGTYESQGGWDCTLAISGTNILVQGTGAVNNNVTWHSTTQIYQVGT